MSFELMISTLYFHFNSKLLVQKLPEWCRHQGDGKNEENPSYAYCWMEVDPTHPALLKKWLGRSSNSNPASAAERRVELVDIYKDLCGRDRFVQLRVKR